MLGVGWLPDEVSQSQFGCSTYAFVQIVEIISQHDWPRAVDDGQ